MVFVVMYGQGLFEPVNIIFRKQPGKLHRRLEVQGAVGVDHQRHVIADGLTGGLDSHGAGRFADAATLMERLYAKHPRNVTVMNNLAVAYQKLQRPDDALRILGKALEVDATAFATHINLADVYLKIRDPAAALEAADAAVAHGPQVAQAHFVRGRVLMRLKRLAEAREALETSVHLDSSNSLVSRLLAELCMRLKDDAGAFPHIERVVRLSPEDLLAWVNLCIVAMRLERPDVAERALEAARRLSPKHPRVQTIEKLWANHKKRQKP